MTSEFCKETIKFNISLSILLFFFVCFSFLLIFSQGCSGIKNVTKNSSDLSNSITVDMSPIKKEFLEGEPIWIVFKIQKKEFKEISIPQIALGADHIKLEIKDDHGNIYPFLGEKYVTTNTDNIYLNQFRDYEVFVNLNSAYGNKYCEKNYAGNYLLEGSKKYILSFSLVLNKEICEIEGQISLPPTEIKISKPSLDDFIAYQSYLEASKELSLGNNNIALELFLKTFKLHPKSTYANLALYNLYKIYKLDIKDMELSNKIVIEFFEKFPNSPFNSELLEEVVDNLSKEEAIHFLNNLTAEMKGTILGYVAQKSIEKLESFSVD